jgi:hypothetical protein
MCLRGKINRKAYEGNAIEACFDSFLTIALYRESNCRSMKSDRSPGLSVLSAFPSQCVGKVAYCLKLFLDFTVARQLTICT